MSDTNTPNPADRKPPGLIIAAPASGSGKTTITLALLRHLRNTGIAVTSAKVGPDYIDPEYHSAASGRTCYNLDAWAMRHTTLSSLIRRCEKNSDMVIAEGVMGLFDGAPDGKGSTADMAKIAGWPIILVVDAQGMAASAAALVWGFSRYQPDVKLAGVIFNRIGGPGHGKILQEACLPLGIPVLGCLPRDDALVLPDRHLGLVQAREHESLDRFLDHAGRFVAQHLDIENIITTARQTACKDTAAEPLLIAAPGKHIALAQDRAFAFCYPFLIESWQRTGAEIMPFSPLDDQAPDTNADAVFLPGGYPELHAQTLAGNGRFLHGLRRAAKNGTFIYGECGGYMVLGEALTDAKGRRHRMAGLLPLQTSFARRQLHLGYRRLTLAADCPFGAKGMQLNGHEFHFSRVVAENTATPLFKAQDAHGTDLGFMGASCESVSGSFAHLIDVADFSY